MLFIDDIHTYYGDSYALHGVTLEVREGQVVALLGRNGMGKTTTVRSIIGFSPPRRGEITYRGKKISGLPPFAVSRLGIGLVPQGRHVFPSLTVEENLVASSRMERKTNPWTLERVYKMFPILKQRARTGAASLSGGEQQMLVIGRALMTNADLLLMDEPSEGLAPLIVRSIADLILLLKGEGLSILLVEQNVALATDVMDYSYVLSNGRVVFKGDVEAFKASPTIQEQFIGVRVAGANGSAGEPSDSGEG